MNHRKASWIGRRVALAAAIASAAYVSTLPLAGAETRPPVANSGLPPVGNITDGVLIGEQAPDFLDAGGRSELLVDLDGRSIHLADFAGRPLLIVFWAAWCVPCRQENPALRAAFHDHAGDNLAVLAIDLQEPTTAVRDYVRAHDLDYTIGLDPAAAVRDLYRARGLPSHFFLDGEGVVRARYAGQMTSELLEQYLAVITAD